MHVFGVLFVLYIQHDFFFLDRITLKGLQIHYEHILTWLKTNVNISIYVSLLEKQNWYQADHLWKIPVVCWQG